MKIIFRVDASHWVGTGHVMRCLALADAFLLSGWIVSFACLPQQGDMIAYIKSRGYKVINLSSSGFGLVPAHDSDYLSWLQRSVEDDASDFINKIDTTDLVITDHYAIDFPWQFKIEKEFGCKIVAIDDLARHHYADCIIDQTLGRTSKEYASSAVTLVGADYALLAPSYSQQRSKALARLSPHTIPRVLVFMGGVDVPNSTLRVLQSLVGAVAANFTVVIGPRATHFHQVSEWCADHDGVTHIDFTENFAALMLEHDVAIGAPGTTSWERACLGLPSIVIPIAENQKMIAEQLVKSGAAISVNLNEIDNKIVGAFQALLKNWDEYYRANLRLCDGKGARRVAISLQQQFETSVICDFELTLASIADIEMVYDWQCHSETRKYALDPSTPTWSAHIAWMEKKLVSNDDYFYILKNRHNWKSAGVLRLDKAAEQNYTVSIYVAPDQYGQGAGSAALMLADLIHPDVTLHATVLGDNTASQIIFEKQNYKRLSREKFIREPIN